MKKKNKWSVLILLFVFFIGLCILLYPAVSDYLNTKSQSQAIVDYESTLSNLSPQTYDHSFQKAEQYNNALATLEFPLLDYNTINENYHALDITGTGMIGYLTIEKIQVEIPIYLGTSADTLNIAVGHLNGSSLPTGGKGTHVAVSAHRGLPSSTLFTNLDHLEIGDTYSITVLNRTLVYQVDQIKTVTPDNTTDLLIDSKQDLCTLITCTPYGVNTHRLLVRGHRIDPQETKAIHITSDAFQIDTMIVTPLVALPMLLIIMIVVLFKPIKRI